MQTFHKACWGSQKEDKGWTNIDDDWCVIARKNLLEVKGQISGDDADVKQVLHVLELALLEVAEDVQGLRETVESGQKRRRLFPFMIFLFFITCFNYLFTHERLAVLQMVPLHDGGAVEFSQRMRTPAEEKKVGSEK